MEDRRPNAENLLIAISKAERNEQKGRLRVFVGMCPGVGKTFSMLKAAHEQQKRGVEVLVGIVETHSRPDTEALLDGLEIFPRKIIPYKGTKLAEMDLDALLKKKPRLVLVDELAHTNTPGVRHKKRYQDVEELLENGIHVYTTINIQHIESRNDQVSQITGVSVRETVPDAFLDQADQIEVIDLSPKELLQRLKEGKVYLGDRAEQAAQNFFKEEQLLALRELSLRFIAERVDRDLNTQMTLKGIEGPWNTNERLLVTVSHSPYASRLIRATRRMAYNLEAPWLALYVNFGEVLSLNDQVMLKKNLNLARELGAEVVTLVDTSLISAIQKICQEKNVTQIVMGRPDRRFFRDLFSKGTVLDQLVRTSSNIDLHVIRAKRPPKYRGFKLKIPEFQTNFLEYYNTVWFLVAISLLCYISLPYVGYRALGSVFLLAILIVASFASFGPIFFAAGISATVWNFVFIPPQFTFVIREWQDTMMVFSFFVTALVSGLLTKRIKRQEKILSNREERARRFYELGKKIADARSIPEILLVLHDVVESQFASEAVALLSDLKSRKLNKPKRPNMSEEEFAVAQWVVDNKKSAGWSTQTLSAANCLCLPMQGQKGMIGVLVLYPKNKAKELSGDQENFLDTVITQVSIAVERLQFSEEAQEGKIYEASEKLHQTLLNSISHELRTPMTTLIGSATALKDDKTLQNKAACQVLTTELIQSVHRLNRVVENLLDTSRLEKGSLQLKKEWFEVNDLVKEVLHHLQVELEGRELSVLGDRSILLEGDFRLLSHAMVNLVLNATKYSSSGTPIVIEINRLSHQLRLSIKDCGSGIPENFRQMIFEKFFRLPGSPAGGIGLGLSIVKSIVELHQGQISAQQRLDGYSGTQFDIELPVPPTPTILNKVIE
ncbi:MAG: sensor histidine kinase KdpD [Bdellovibrionales bacterium]|nr:sensor histidine kinase KdpD [Bdellovibrionales bacterium]